MGIHSLQDFVDSLGKYSIPLTSYLETTTRRTSNLLLLNADSCLRQFYHENIDWVCGGQWSELFQCVEKFVRAFRLADIELVVFFDGSLNKRTICHWTAKQEAIREEIKDVVVDVEHNNVIFHSKSRDFIPPASLKIALRLAFRACNVLVCSSLEDTCKETVLYCKDEKCIGIIGNDSSYFFCKLPSYISIGKARWIKKLVSACKVQNFRSLMNDFDLLPGDLPYFAALIGSYELPDSYLSPLYWDLLEDDNPLKRVKENLPSDAVLPPSDLRIKCVANFVSEKRDEIKDLKWLSKLIFENSSKLNVEEGVQRLKGLIDYYKDILNASKASKVPVEEENEWSAAGYPKPSESKDVPNHHSRYKKNWKFYDRTKSSNNTKRNNGSQTNNKTSKIDDPEKVLKEGTLEEAAQALEQLELKESGATQETTLEEEKHDEVNGDTVSIANEEKPSIEEKDEEYVTKNFDEEENNIDYPREITITPVLSTIHDDVLDIARKRHQSGQMCQEVLNLLTKGEFLINMTFDVEEPKTRLPIPLIYRPLRQFMYGVLFGAKPEDKDITDEKTADIDEDDVTENEENKEIEDEEQPKENGVSDNGKIKLEVEEEANSKIENEVLSKDDDVKSEDENVFMIKEWCVHSNKDLKIPDTVKPRGLSWGVPSLKKLWFGTDSEDNANRLKAFLSCMKSDTVNMSNTAMVPQRLMLLCCVLRYLIQQDSKVSILSKQDIDAFLAQALSAQLTTEHNTQNLANLKLSQVDSRCVQLSAIFMSGIENAVIANDVCGSPVPWEYCCPWNFFDGKLFHSKWLQSTMNFSVTDLCEGKPHIVEKLERLRWCITEGLELKYRIIGLEQTKKFFSPFGTPISMHSTPFNGVMRPPGAHNLKGRSRGSGAKQLVHGSGGTLHVAGVPVAHWGGNKAGVGYSKNAPTVLVGGPNCVDLPSDHKRGWRGRGRGRRDRGRGGGAGYGNANNVGRGLLETPYISPWQQGYGYEEMQNANFKRYMKGVQKIEQVRANISKATPYQRPSYNSRQGYQQNVQQQQQHQQQAQQQSQPNQQHANKTSQPLQHNSYYSQPPHPSSQMNKQTDSTFNKNMWLGKGRGQQQTHSNSFVSPISQGYRSQQHRYGRGQWMNNINSD